MLWTVINGGIGSIWEFLFMLGGYLVLLGIMMPVHETAHAFVAYKLGDPTARNMGRLTLNPLAHFDPIGSLMILLFGIGYAKAVPVKPRNFKNERGGMALVALAGPVSNLLMAFLSLLIFRLVASFTGGFELVGGTFYYYNTVTMYAYIVLVEVFAGTNLMLAVFNLLPLPPLDGSRIFGALLPAKWTYWMDQYHTYVRMGVLLLVVTGVLDVPLRFLERVIGNGLCFLCRLPGLF